MRKAVKPNKFFFPIQIKSLVLLKDKAFFIFTINDSVDLDTP